MGRSELLDDLFSGEPVAITLRNGVSVAGIVHSRHRSQTSSDVGSLTIIEHGSTADNMITSTVTDDQVERIVTDDVEWRHRD